VSTAARHRDPEATGLHLIKVNRLNLLGPSSGAFPAGRSVFVISAVGREEEEEEEGRRRTLQHLGSLALDVIGNNRGHRGRVALFHLRVIPAINPSDKPELFSIDMFTREVHI